MDGESIYRVAFGKDRRPDPWQRALMDEAWPRVLIAPTGSGKTAAVTLGWIAHRLRAPGATPRRLVWCLPMRTLVEQTVEAVQEWLGNLAAHPLAPATLPAKEDVHILMGGLETRAWIEQPERPAVIVGTQDMLLSRALMRGYASSRANWPMEFALLHDDAQWVFDEVQLMGTGRATSAQLDAFRRSEAKRTVEGGHWNGRPARSLWVSATLEPEWLATVDHRAPEAPAVMRVDPATEVSGRLTHIAGARKALRPADVAPRATEASNNSSGPLATRPASAKAGDLKRYIDTLADAVRSAHRPGRMTLVIVNRVNRAQELYAGLGRSFKRSAEPRPELALIHSRFRPADRKRETAKLPGDNASNLIVVATQAIEAGVDLSAAVLFTELAPWSSMVQRFGRANRYAELDTGAEIHWIDLLGEPTGEDNDKTAKELALPYEVEELRAARERLLSLTDAAFVHLPPPDAVDAPLRVIRRKDLVDLFDTDADLTGFDVDISPYVRDADDTDVHVFWRDLSGGLEDSPRARSEELCAAPISQAKDWVVKKVRKKSGANVFVRDLQWRRGDSPSGGAPPGWAVFREDPWPGMTLLANIEAGGYSDLIGFTGDTKARVSEIPEVPPAERQTDTETDRGHPSPHEPGITQGDSDTVGATPDMASGSAPMTDEDSHDDDPRSATGVLVSLTDHLDHVATEAVALCDALAVAPEARAAIVRAARWHDLGKAHAVFQDTMRRGLDGHDVPDDMLLAKTIQSKLRHQRGWFRHELASALAFLAHEDWSRDADLVAYLIAAHHGKVRMNIKALPRERAPEGQPAGTRFARGVWEGDELPPVDMGSGDRWAGGPLTLSIMELGWDEATRESWTERTRDLLARFGPFRLAWMETILRLADWRASAKEREGVS